MKKTNNQGKKAITTTAGSISFHKAPKGRSEQKKAPARAMEKYSPPTRKEIMAAERRLFPRIVQIAMEIMEDYPDATIDQAMKMAKNSTMGGYFINRNQNFSK